VISVEAHGHINDLLYKTLTGKHEERSVSPTTKQSRENTHTTYIFFQFLNRSKESFGSGKNHVAKRFTQILLRDEIVRFLDQLNGGLINKSA
jgi:hypothetical protein